MLCVHLLPETGAAGAENQALALLSGLLERPDIELELVYYEEGRNHAAFVELGVPLHRIGRRARLTLDFPRRVHALRRLYRRRQPEILHTWMFEATVVGMRAARRWPSTRTVLAQRSGTMEREMPGHLRALRASLARADQALANSPEGVELLVDLGMPSERVVLVGQGVPPARLVVRTPPQEVRRIHGIPEDAPLLVGVGRADHTKDWPGLFAALEILRRQRPDVWLLLVGPTWDGLDPLGVWWTEGVVAAGWRESPADELAAADVVVVPSWTEGNSNVAGEALMLGRPVVTTDAGAHPPVVAAAGGRVVPIRRPDLLAGAILDTLADPPEPAAVRAAAEQRLSTHAVMEETIGLYERVLAGSGS